MGITPNYDLDVDTSLGGNSASDYVIPSQKAIKSYVDNNSGTSIPPIAYGISTTAASTAEKVVSISEITELNSGQIIVVSPTKSATVGNLTIKLNNFDAYPILYAGAAITTSTDSVVWNANQPSAFIFNGTNWLFLCHGLDSNTTYSTMPVLEGVTGTATNNRTLQAANLKQIIQGTTLTDLTIATASTVLDTDSITDGIGKLQAQINALPSIPTNISAFTNDSGYITSSALSPYALSSSLATVATSGSYYDLDDKPTIPTVNNATLTIQKNSTTVKTFTANASTDVTCNITVPTKTSDLTNDSGYTTNVGTVTKVNNTSPDSSGNVSLTIPTVNNATLTIQKNGTTVNTFTANASSNVTANITVPTTAAEVNAANTDLSNLSATGNLKLCGNIVKKDQNVISSTSLNGSSNLNKKSVLETYLPNDDYTYLVLVCADCDTTTTSGNYFKLSINTGLVGIVRLCQARTRSSSTVMAGGSVWIPVDSTRQFDIVRSSGFNGTATVDLRAYWRVM
jgi:hypothetical protein